MVERDGALLLVRRAPHLLEGDTWGLPGGFLDRDETLAEGVLRELHEETGWTGRVVGLLRVNSNPIRRHEDRQNVAFDFVIEPLARPVSPTPSRPPWPGSPSTGCRRSTALSFDHGDTVRAYLAVRGRLPDADAVDDLESDRRRGQTSISM